MTKMTTPEIARVCRFIREQSASAKDLPLPQLASIVRLTVEARTDQPDQPDIAGQVAELAEGLHALIENRRKDAAWLGRTASKVHTLEAAIAALRKQMDNHAHYAYDIMDGCSRTGGPFFYDPVQPTPRDDAAPYYVEDTEEGWGVFRRPDGKPVAGPSLDRGVIERIAKARNDDAAQDEALADVVKELLDEGLWTRHEYPFKGVTIIKDGMKERLRKALDGDEAQVVIAPEGEDVDLTVMSDMDSRFIDGYVAGHKEGLRTAAYALSQAGAPPSPPPPMRKESMMFDSWEQLMEEYGSTDEEVDALFDQPWPGQLGYQEPIDDDEEVDDAADAEGTLE